MTLEEFKALRQLQDRRVHMIFSDGCELIATLVNVTMDMDESRHLVYDKVEWSSVPIADGGAGAYYSPGENLKSCCLLPDNEP